MDIDNKHKSIPVGYTIALIALVYVISLVILGKDGFWNVDDANKFLQLEAIHHSHYRDFSIPWSGTSIDPHFDYNPIPSPFSVVKDNRLFSIYSPVFATLSSFFFTLFGFWGLYVLPLVFSVILLFGMAKILETLGAENKIKNYAVILAGLCTPLWFYSVIFWEHIIAISLAVWGVAFCLQFLKSGSRKHLLPGIIFSTLGIYFRDDLYLFCAVLLGGVILFYPKERFKNTLLCVFGMITCLIPLWLLQWKTVGEPLGFHIGKHLLSSSGILGHIADRPQVFYNLFVASSKNLWLSLVLAAPFLVAFALNLKLPLKTFKTTLPLYALAALIVSVFSLGGYLHAASPIAYMLNANSLFAVSPVLIWAFIGFRHPEGPEDNLRLTRWIWSVTLAYAIFYGLFAPKLGSTGIHWGNRFLLVLYPLFAVLCAINLAEWSKGFDRKINWQTCIIIIVILVSFAAQLYSLDILHKKKDFSVRFNREIAKLPEEAVVTNLWWVPQELCREFYAKTIFYVRTPVQYRNLAGKLSSRGFKDLIFITPFFSNGTEPNSTEVIDGGLNFFNVRISTIDLTFLQKGTE